MDLTARVDRELLGGLQVMSSIGLPTSREQVPGTRRALNELAAKAAVRYPPDTRVSRVDHRVRDRDDVSVRLYRPAAEGPLPAVYWIHGGGLISGSIDTEDPYCSRLALALDIAVISVDYRLAPENPYPVPVEDCYAGLRFAFSQAKDWGIDDARVALGGASAGGGLAAGTALLARDRRGPEVRALFLMYPMLDDRNDTASSREFAEMPSWGRANNINSWDCYLGGAEQVTGYAAPARAQDLRGLPPTLIQVGELDLFRDEDIAFATRLLGAGVPTELHVYPGAYHGWDIYAPRAALTRQALADRDESLRRVLDIPVNTTDGSRR